MNTSPRPPIAIRNLIITLQNFYQKVDVQVITMCGLFCPFNLTNKFNVPFHRSGTSYYIYEIVASTSDLLSAISAGYMYLLSRYFCTLRSTPHGAPWSSRRLFLVIFLVNIELARTAGLATKR